jgi:polysaccharide export outer membrane protein
MTKWRYGVFAALLPALSACATGPAGEAPSIELAKLETLPIPSEADYQMPAGIARIRPLDKLQVDVFGVPDLSRPMRVDSDGTLDFPLIGTVAANGLTANELAARIEDGLRGPYIKNPDVMVSVLESTAQLVTVGGEVDKPGQYPVIGPMTLMKAVAAGGGTSTTAQLKEVAVFRTVNGQHYIGLYDMKAIARGNYADPAIYPNDVIMVGESQTRRVLSAIAGVTPLLTSGVILVDRLAR